MSADRPDDSSWPDGSSGAGQANLGKQFNEQFSEQSLEDMDELVSEFNSRHEVSS